MKSALLTFLFFLPTIVFAQSDTASLRNSGNDYVRICGAAAQGQASPNAAACGIWLTGVMDGLQAYNTNMKALPLFDAPNLAVGPVAKLLVNYVTSHLQLASLPTSALVLGALVEAYPRKEASATPKN
ncbi:MAG TPA: Rap1a/Tai family immunity protein [Terriglobales bacterium]